MTTRLYSVSIRTEEDVIALCRRTRDLAAQLGFSRHEQALLAGAALEIARNAVTYAGGCAAEYAVLDGDPAVFNICIADQGPGIPDLRKILKSGTKSRTGAGAGIAAARAMVDSFSMESELGSGTVVRLGKSLPAGARPFTPQRLAKIAAEGAKAAPRCPLDELRQENQDLLQALEELRLSREDAARRSAELEELKCGVAVLHSEVEEKDGWLRSAGQLKSRILARMSHDFRTPLMSILALGRLLADESDGSLSSEQQKQVSFIRKSAESMLEMVNGLLCMARVEAAKPEVHATAFRAASLFRALRGLARRLPASPDVHVIFEDAQDVPALFTDEAKVAQVLRNFIANALQVTEKGEVRVSGRASEDGRSAIFSVSGSGIAVTAGDTGLLSPDVGEAAGPGRARSGGAGPGFSVSKGLAELLGGSAGVQSVPGRGTVFTAEIPLVYLGGQGQGPANGTGGILLIDGEDASRYLVRQALGPLGTAMEAADGAEAIELAKKRRPRVILLDVRMPGRNGFQVLNELKADPATREIPVVILTALALTREEMDALNAQAAAVLSKEVLSQRDGGERLRVAIAGSERGR